MNTIGLVAQRITRLTTDQKIAGSNPAEIEQTHFVLLYKYIPCHTNNNQPQHVMFSINL